MFLHPLSFWAARAHSPPPGIQADFSATPLAGPVPLTVTFENKTSGAATFYAWDFDVDGSIDSYSTSPVFIYTSPGTYSVQFVAGNPGTGVYSTTVKSNYIVVCASPTAPAGNFIAIPQSGYAPLEVAFAASASGPLSQIYWDPDDDGDYDSFGSAVSYQYTTPGTYRPRMILGGLDGIDTVVSGVEIVVCAPPISPSTSAVVWQSWRERT